MYSLRKSLKQGNKAIGSWISTGSPIVAELMAGCGFDFLAVDVEHSAVDLPQTQQIFQAIRAGNPDCAPMVRLHGVDYPLAKRYADAGARGIIGPLVNNAEQAKQLVDAIKYPPQGNRGVGFCRANRYGKDLGEEFERANEEILVAVQIEHIEGVQNIESILKVEGVDAIFIGPYDLSASMGITGQFDHPDFREARNKILGACLNKKIISGLHVIQPDPEELDRRVKEGYSLIAYSLDITMLLNASQEGVQNFRKNCLIQSDLR